MDERRDLVDREELRQELELEMSECVDGKIGRGRRFGLQCAIGILNSLDAVECPRGWTRDEVLAELDADPDAVCEVQDPFSAEWVSWAHTWVGQWLDPDVPRTNVRVEVVERAPEWVPLTQLVGRTIAGETEPVTSPPVWTLIDGRVEWRWLGISRIAWHPFPEGTLNLETGQVAVRPKAAT